MGRGDSLTQPQGTCVHQWTGWARVRQITDMKHRMCTVCGAEQVRVEPRSVDWRQGRNGMWEHD